MLTAEQHENRATGIGGSDAAAVCGLNPYKSPVDVYLEKVGAAAPVDETERMFWGNKLEDVVADVYSDRTGRKVRRRNRTCRHRDCSRHGRECSRFVRTGIGSACSRPPPWSSTRTILCCRSS